MAVPYLYPFSRDISMAAQISLIKQFPVF